jgi:hypothetical protein
MVPRGVKSLNGGGTDPRASGSGGLTWMHVLPKVEVVSSGHYWLGLFIIPKRALVL